VASLLKTPRTVLIGTIIKSRLQDGRYVRAKAANNVIMVIINLRGIHWERILAEVDQYAMQRE
jgi:hypothetical protein